jgi:NitT/TauT family transport system permease protein
VSAVSTPIVRRSHPRGSASRGLTIPNEPLFFGILGFVVILVLWEAVVDLGMIKALLISSPTRIVAAAVADFSSGVIWPQIGTSLLEWIVGFGIGLGTAIPIGLALGVSRRLEFLFDPWLAAIYATPIVALVPLVILVFGVGLDSKFFVVFLETFTTVAISTLAGTHSADKRHLDTARSFRASRGLIFRSVTLPTTVPFIISGVRLGAGRALVGVIIAEFIAANAGIGFYISFNGTTLNTSRVMLGIALLGIFGLTVGNVIRRVERRFDVWRPAIR